MCTNCEEQVAAVLEDPEKRERFVQGLTNDAMFVGVAMARAAVVAANEQKLGPHLGPFALCAVASVLAERVKETLGPKSTELVDLVRAEVGKRLIVVAQEADPTTGALCLTVGPLSRETH